MQQSAERRAQTRVFWNTLGAEQQQTTLVHNSDNTQHSNTATHHSTATHTPPLLANQRPTGTVTGRPGGGVLEQVCVFIPTPRHVARAVCEIRWGRTEY
jgi:hypothetical protein